MLRASTRELCLNRFCPCRDGGALAHCHPAWRRSGGTLEVVRDRQTAGAGARYNYLGEEAAKALFTEDEPPAFFFAMTLPAMSFATPASTSWHKPIISYLVLPQDDEKKMTEASTRARGRRRAIFSTTRR